MNVWCLTSVPNSVTWWGCFYGTWNPGPDVYYLLLTQRSWDWCSNSAPMTQHVIGWLIGIWPRKENVYCNQAASRSKIQSEVHTHGKLNNNYTYSLYLKSYSSANGLYCIQKLSVCRSCWIPHPPPPLSWSHSLVSPFVDSPFSTGSKYSGYFVDSVGFATSVDSFIPGCVPGSRSPQSL